MKFYSWKDIERFCSRNNAPWKGTYSRIEVYPSEIIAYKILGINKSLVEVFSAMFPRNFNTESCTIRLDIGMIDIPVFEEIEEDSDCSLTIPLFKEMLYKDTTYGRDILPELSCPVIAFHSYKGGVGRTLSLIAFAKAWSSVIKDTRREKLLIVDSDIEAPGLTWTQNMIDDDSFSYLDLISLIQDNLDIERVVEQASLKIGTSLITIDNGRKTIDHIFLPTYRYIDQLLDLYASPSTIVNGNNKEYCLAEVLAKVGRNLGVGAVLVDLRAGLSELSAPLLFDPRVKKYLVTSTSTQSLSGTIITLDFLTKGLVIGADTLLPEVLLNMVPDTISYTEKTELYTKLISVYNRKDDADNDSYIDNVITELPFASELIHLTSIKQILDRLRGREFYYRIEEIVKQKYASTMAETDAKYPEETREEKLKRIKEVASAQIAAEGNGKLDLLITAPLKYLSKQYQDAIPTTVILGAKGSGKTFLYRKFVEAKCWDSFFNSMGKITSYEYLQDTMFVPVLATRNVQNMIDNLNSCIDVVNSSVQGMNIEKGVYLHNGEKIQNRRNVYNWKDYWERLLVDSLGMYGTKFTQIDKQLMDQGKRIVFLIDGLEDYLPDVAKSIGEKQAIQALCQDIVSKIKSECSNIGIIVFLRRDLAQNAITVNYTQFTKVYERAELKWSSNEALRLAVWLVSQADDSFYNEEVGVDQASDEIIEKYLIQLWGLKLGKASSNEAYSSRWILAALSDFNGQLQARDIIRFLQYAATPGAKKAPYDDRLLMPKEIKKAVQKCSTEKMREIKDEYVTLKPIFEKLEKLPTEKRVLPLELNDAGLSTDEEKSLMQEGYLKRVEGVYYLPEIVRHALGFKYQMGARPKVLALTL